MWPAGRRRRAGGGEDGSSDERRSRLEPPGERHQAAGGLRAALAERLADLAHLRRRDPAGEERGERELEEGAVGLAPMPSGPRYRAAGIETTST